MTQTELPLYPKVSSIYNKIMQLAIAIFIIIVLMNLWFYSQNKNQQTIEQHYRFIGQQYLSQLALATGTLLSQDKSAVRAFLEQSGQQLWIKDISLYDETGQLIEASSDQGSINDLYGFSLYKADRSEQFTPFVQELRVEGQLKGYLRLTIEDKALVNELHQVSEQHFQLLRLMMILAVLVGFLLTRGLNRFSRQSFRLAK